MRTVTVKDIIIGEGIPKICVPIVAGTQQEAVRQAKTIAPLVKCKDRVVDLVEWRADWLTNVDQPGVCQAAVTAIREVLPDVPLLFTFRTKEEGGEQQLSQQVYLELILTMAQSGLMDLVDIELSAGDDSVKTVLEVAHRNGVSVICSNHDFHATPSREEILSRLEHMEILGADILKIAAMPRNSQDVLTMLGATAEMFQHTNCPLITMSMSALGIVSRLSGEAFGSALTFGTVGKASAPGQISAEELRRILNIVHG